MSRLQETRNYFMAEPKSADLDTLLDEIQVIEIEDDLPRQHSLNGWYGVTNHQGIIAYFGTEEEACFYRLAFINRILNL